MKVGLLDGLVSRICTVPVHTVQWYSKGTFRNYTEYIASIEVQCDIYISPPTHPMGSACMVWCSVRCHVPASGGVQLLM